MTRQNIEDPTGLVVSTATSVWVPAAPSHFFDFLRDEYHRSKWDILSSGASMLEKAHIAKGPNLGNVVSLLTVSDTLKSPPAENKAMKKDTLYGIGVTTIFYISVGCMGYAAFGNAAPGNVLTGFDEPFWLVDIANIAVVIHLIRAYQVYGQQIYAKYEEWLGRKWPESTFFHRVYTLQLPLAKSFRFTLCRFILRTVFIIITTLVAMMLPYFNTIIRLLGAIAFRPLTVYYIVTVYMAQENIKIGQPNQLFCRA